MSTRTKPPQQRPKKVFKKTVAATDKIRADLLSGFYPPGWLNREELAKQLGMNSMTLSPIFDTLAAEGLLEKRQHRQRATYYVPDSRPLPALTSAALLAEAQASVALDGETRSLEGGAHTAVPSATKGKETIPELIADILRDGIRKGTYPVGSQLPTMKVLAAGLGTNQPAISSGVNILRNEGLVKTMDSRRGIEVIALPSEPAKPTPEQAAVEMAQSLQMQPPRLTSREEIVEPAETTQPPLTKRQTVTEYLKEAILNGDFPADSLLPSRDVLATKLGVGSTTVDYVIGRLEVAGLVSIVPGRGAVVLPEAERQTINVARSRPAPPIDEDSEPGDLISAGEVLPIIRVLSDENRQLRAAQETAKNAAERLASYEEEIKRLRGQVAEERGNARRLDDENAELRGKLHRRGGNGKVIHTFGADFKNGVGWSDADAAHIKDLMAAPKGAKVQ